MALLRLRPLIDLLFVFGVDRRGAFIFGLLAPASSMSSSSLTGGATG